MPFDGKPAAEKVKLKRDPNCSRCGLCENAETVCLLGSGPKHADIMIIGEAPGRQEDEEGKPFVERSGDLLDELLENAGLDRDDIYITNAVHCRPPDNRTPKKKEIEACKHWLEKEIEAVKPKYVLTTGNIPLQALFGLKGIRKLRGMPIEKDGIIYFPTYHPSYALRDERQKPVIESDIKQFAKIIKKGGIGTEQGLNFHIVSSMKDVEAMISDIRRNKTISIDTEDTSLNQFEPGFQVVSLGVGTRDNQWCLPLAHSKGWLANNKWRRKRIVKMIDDALRGKELVMQNGKFDTLCMAVVYGVWWYCDFDVMLAHYNLDENSPHDLGILSQIYLDALDYDIPLEEKQGKTGDLERHCKYLAMDVYYTRKLRFIFRRMLRDDPATEALFFQLTMPVSRMYTDIEYVGVPIDREQLEKAREQYRKQASESLEELNRLVPDKRQWKNKKTKQVQIGINWGSPDQVADVFFNRLGMEALDKTKGGKNSTSESVLLRLAKDTDRGGEVSGTPSKGARVAQLLLSWREATKNIGFLDSWDKLAVDDRLHPTFKIHGTVTGRPSCADPNLQQVPRNPVLRSVIGIPKRLRHLLELVDSDQSQVEMRVATELSQDPTLKLIYQTGGDVHTATVQEIFGIEKPDKEQRKKGKAINFGFLFGMWWRKFIIYARDNYDVEFTDREAQEIRARFFRKYAALVKWHDKQRKFANRNGYVRNLIGRKRRLFAAMRRDDTPECREAERQAINSPVQSFASDVTLMGALAMHGDYTRDSQRHQRGVFKHETCRIVGTIHDSILTEVKRKELDNVVPLIKKTMSWPPLLDKFEVQMSVPLVAESAVGSWGVGKAA